MLWGLQILLSIATSTNPTDVVWLQILRERALAVSQFIASDEEHPMLIAAQLVVEIINAGLVAKTASTPQIRKLEHRTSFRNDADNRDLRCFAGFRCWVENTSRIQNQTIVTPFCAWCVGACCLGACCVGFQAALHPRLDAAFSACPGVLQRKAELAHARQYIRSKTSATSKTNATDADETVPAGAAIADVELNRLLLAVSVPCVRCAMDTVPCTVHGLNRLTPVSL